MDQEANAGYYREHGQRQAVQHKVETDIEITDRHPRPQRLNKRLLAVVEELNTNQRRDQRRETNRAHANGGGEILRPAATGESQ